MAILVNKLRKAMEPVTHTPAEIAQGIKLNPKRQLPTSEILEVRDATAEELKSRNVNQPKGYITMEVRGSNNKIYKIVVPQSYYGKVPKVWEWNVQRYEVAEMIAYGYPMESIAEHIGIAKIIIYGWLNHPEFREHVDGITLETGWANKRERISGLNRVTRLLFDKVVNEIDDVKLSDKSIGSVLLAIQTIAKQLGQEKEEFIEQSRVDQHTNITGAIGIATVSLDSKLNDRTSEERAKLQLEFDELGNDIIRAITGEKE